MNVFPDDIYAAERRPFAAQARALCPEPNHNERSACQCCRALESRLTPVTDALRAVLEDADLTITFRREDVLPVGVGTAETGETL